MEIELKGHIYQIGKLDAFKQWHVARRLMPLFGSMAEIGDKASMLKTLAPALDALSLMSNDDTDFVLNTCLGVVRRKNPETGGMFPVLGGKNVLMFEDIDMTVLLRLTTYVVTENLSDFFTQAASENNEAAGHGQV